MSLNLTILFEEEPTQITLEASEKVENLKAI